MTTMYCVIGYNHDGQEFEGVFSTFEKAKEHSNAMQEFEDQGAHWNSYCVEEFELDKPVTRLE